MDCLALSPSRINTNNDCEFKYFLQYHLRLPESKESNIYGVKGTAAHEALEFYANFKRGLKEEAEEDVEKTLKAFYAKTELWKLDNGIRKAKGFTHPVGKYCEGCPWATKGGLCSIANIPFVDVEGCPRPNFEDDLALVKKTVARSDYDIFNRKIIGAEVKFDLDIEDIRVRGVIDLVTEMDDETIEIIDFKSGNSTKGHAAARKDAQMRTYNLVAKLIWPEYKYRMMTLYYLRKVDGIVTCVFSKEDDELTMKSLHRAWNSIKENQDPHRPSYPFWLCNYCVGHDKCGIIKDSFVKNGKFKLPVVNCNYTDTQGEPCYEGLSAENPNKVTASTTDQMTYACVGHYQVHKGGEYVPDSNKTS